MTAQADILLITVNKYETQAVLQVFQEITGTEAEQVPIDDRLYRNLGAINGTQVFHALSEMGSGGLGATQQTVDKGIRALNPRAVIAIGIAFGINEKEQRIGDIMLSKQLRLYELQRAGQKIVLRGDKPHASTRLINFFEGVAQTSWQGSPVRPGVILTGEKLVDDLDYRDQLLQFEPEAIGGEMEGAGLYVSSHDHKVDWIVIKAICDWADGQKSKNKEAHQKKAAKSAADFVAYALQQASLPGTGVRSEGTRIVVGRITEATDDLKKEIRIGAIRATRNRLKQLPASSRDFSGREAELSELRQAVRQGNVTISGVQGLGRVGKTALALKLAHEFKDSYADAQIYLDLKGVSPQPLSPAEIMWHVISSFEPEMKRPDDADLPMWYNSLLNANQVLLLYDNARDAAQIAPLLPPDHCLLLVTSRKRFTLPGMLNKNLDEMTEADAEELVLKIAPRLGEHAAAIAKQCGYLPIALCAAASALKVKRTLPPEDYLKLLRDRKERLKLRDDVGSLTIEASFGLSYELLSEELRRRWRKLAIFPTDFDAPAAATVWQTEVADATYSLAELEEYSLLGWTEATFRYSLHDLVRDYADIHLTAEEREQAGILHATHYSHILETISDLYYNGREMIAEGLSLFDNERINIGVGHEWASTRFVDDEQAALLCAIYPIVAGDTLFLRLHPRDILRWHEIALFAAKKLSIREFEAMACSGVARAYSILGEVSKAVDYQQQALTIAREIGNKYHEMNGLNNSGIAYYELGKIRSSIDYYKQAFAIAHDIGNKIFEGLILNGLGADYQALGKVRAAIKHYKQALTIAREVDDKLSVGVSLGNLGKAYSLVGKIKKARRFLEEALQICEEVESPYARTIQQWLTELNGVLPWLLRLRLIPLVIIVLNWLKELSDKGDE